MCMWEIRTRIQIFWIANICCAAIVIWQQECICIFIYICICICIGQNYLHLLCCNCDLTTSMQPFVVPYIWTLPAGPKIDRNHWNSCYIFFPRLNLNLNEVKSFVCMKWIFVSVPCPYYGWRGSYILPVFWHFLQYPIYSIFKCKCRQNLLQIIQP